MHGGPQYVQPVEPSVGLQRLSTYRVEAAISVDPWTGAEDRGAGRPAGRPAGNETETPGNLRGYCRIQYHHREISLQLDLLDR